MQTTCFVQDKDLKNGPLKKLLTNGSETFPQMVNGVFSEDPSLMLIMRDANEPADSSVDPSPFFELDPNRINISQMEPIQDGCPTGGKVSVLDHLAV